MKENVTGCKQLWAEEKLSSTRAGSTAKNEIYLFVFINRTEKSWRKRVRAEKHTTLSHSALLSCIPPLVYHTLLPPSFLSSDLPSLFYSCILRSCSISPINQSSLPLSLLHYSFTSSLPLASSPFLPLPPPSPRFSLHPIYLENSAAAALKPTTN